MICPTDLRPCLLPPGRNHDVVASRTMMLGIHHTTADPQQGGFALLRQHNREHNRGAILPYSLLAAILPYSLLAAIMPPTMVSPRCGRHDVVPSRAWEKLVRRLLAIWRTENLGMIICKAGKHWDDWEKIDLDGSCGKSGAGEFLWNSAWYKRILGNCSWTRRTKEQCFVRRAFWRSLVP